MTEYDYFHNLIASRKIDAKLKYLTLVVSIELEANFLELHVEN